MAATHTTFGYTRTVVTYRIATICPDNIVALGAQDDPGWAAEGALGAHPGGEAMLKAGGVLNIALRGEVAPNKHDGGSATAVAILTAMAAAILSLQPTAASPARAAAVLTARLHRTSAPC